MGYAVKLQRTEPAFNIKFNKYYYPDQGRKFTLDTSKYIYFPMSYTGTTDSTLGGNAELVFIHWQYSQRTNTNPPTFNGYTDKFMRYIGATPPSQMSIDQPTIFMTTEKPIKEINFLDYVASDFSYTVKKNAVYIIYWGAYGPDSNHYWQDNIRIAYDPKYALYHQFMPATSLEVHLFRKEFPVIFKYQSSALTYGGGLIEVLFE